MNEIKITLETLYDILRNEKKREDLQKLDDSFFIDIVAYLREKQALIDSKKKGDDLFAVGERDKLEYELRSIKRIIKQLYELREKKIMDIAMNKSRTGSDIIDTSSMLRLEKQFYEQTLQTLDTYRRGVLLQLFKGELPDIIDLPAKHSVLSSFSSLSTHSSSSSSSSPSNSSFSTTLSPPPPSSPPPARASSPAFPPSKPAYESAAPLGKTASAVTKIKFLHPVPRFVWKDMKEYGPFEAGEETTIFPEVADLLIRKGRAEKG